MTVNGARTVKRRNKIKKNKAKLVLKEIILLIPNFLKLLWRLELDPRVPPKEKIILAATVVYVVSPFDFVPDFIPFFGQVDDIYLIALVLTAMLNSVGEEVILQHWDGNKNVLVVIKRILDTATLYIPHRIEKKLQNRADGK